jgi:neutral ceramidase
MATQIKAGIDRIIINPSLGSYLIGYANRKGGAKSIHSDLTATTLVLSSNLKEFYVIISLDLLGVNWEVVDRIKKSIYKLTKIPAKNIRICCAHTHSGPVGWAPEKVTLKEKFSELISKLNLAAIEPITTKGINSNKKYIDKLITDLAKSVKKAFKSLKIVEVKYGITEAEFNINRRNTICNLPADRKKDKSINIVQLIHENNPVATIVNYACHNVGFGPKSNAISSDITGVMRSKIEKEVDGYCLFIQGATGDINPDLEWCKDNTHDINRIGNNIADAIIQKFHSLTKTEINSINSLTDSVKAYIDIPKEIVNVPIKEIPKRMISKLGKVPKWLINSMLDIRYPWKTQLLKDEKGYHTPIEIGVMKLGNILLVSASMEPFVETGLKIKKISNSKMTIFAGYTDGLTGYLPPKSEYKAGGYEIDLVPYFYRLPGIFRKDTEKKAVYKIIELMNSV